MISPKLFPSLLQSAGRPQPRRSEQQESLALGRISDIRFSDLLTPYLVAGILISFAVFVIWPQLDLRVSEIFFDPADGFIIEGHPVTEALRQIIWNLGILLCLCAVVGTALGTVGRTMLLPARVWGFILTLYILGPGVMVELLTKPLWGRARPAQIVDFGGSLPVSFPNEFVDVCTRNCSFVSGEVSGATVTALAFLFVRSHLRQRLPAKAAACLLFVALCLPPTVALQRVASGRHFLSDTVFAVLFTLALALALSALLGAAFRKMPQTE